MARPATPILFAHRGGRAAGPENELETFRRALEAGATGLETDAWLTRDGEVVLDHDGETPDGIGIGATLRRDLASHIPTLAELYEACGTDFELSVDLKDAATFSQLVAVAREHGAEDRLWLCHTRWREIAEWRLEVATVHLVDSTFVGFMKGGPELRAQRLAAAGIDAVNLHRSEWTSDLVEVFHGVGVSCFGWDAQEREEIRGLLELGVDAVYSDHVDRLLAEAGRLAR